MTHGQVLHLYSNFSFAHHPHVKDAASMPLVHAKLKLAGAKAGANAGCAWDQHCPPCTDGRAPGRWVAAYTMKVTECLWMPTGG